MGCLHSAVEPQEKAALLRRFNSGQLRALLLTDAYGLGLDFKDVDVVLGVSCLTTFCRKDLTTKPCICML
jgi:superfamily II DNA/RNA helicase